MKYKIRALSVQIAVSMLLLANVAQGATVQWNGGPIVQTTVTDQNINISNANIMGANINVSSIGVDVVISVTTNDATITSTVNDTVFCLSAALGRTITINLEDSLAFLSGANLTTPFIVIFQGPGNLVVNIEGGQSLTFGAQGGATVGTRFFVVMSATNVPTVTFERNPLATAPDLNASVVVGANSMISYLGAVPVSSGTSTEQGRILFNPTNVQPNYGALQVVIADTGSVIISGHLYTGSCPHNGSINLAVPAGLEAIVTVTNTSPGNSSAPLVITNFNNTYSPNLLIDPFCLDAYTGVLNGFTLQANGQINVGNQAYIFYQGGTINVPPIPDTQGSCGFFIHQAVKDRNPSAFVVDGNTTTTNAIPAQINLADVSAIYFASIANCGNCTTISQDGSTGNWVSSLTPETDVTGAGNIVFDVEGVTNVVGGPLHASALNVVSLVTSIFGGSVLINGASVNFPLRTFLVHSDGSYQRFPRSCFLINNDLNLFNTNLKHDDQSHNATVQFLPDNSILVQPEPTYIGGEVNVTPPAPCNISSESRFILPGCPAPDNAIQLYNSCVLVHTNIASTGFIWRTPNLDPQGNQSCIKFYSNGRCIDNGTGRNFILGGLTGALATDGSHVVNPNAHLDVLQTSSATNPLHTLSLLVGYNNQKVTQGLTYNIVGQDSVQNIIQLYGSNICAGTDTVTQPLPSYALVTTPTITIAGNYFDFISQGGQLQDPSSSGVTAQGAIFVDTNGTFQILPNLRALIGAVVAKSGNGVVILPTSQVLFWQGAGIQEWALDLATPNQLVVVPAGQQISNYTLDWQYTVKDFCTTNSYVPYTTLLTDTTTGCPYLAYRTPYIPQNMQGLPVVHGTVDQFQWKNSRIGDSAQLIVDNGLIRELVFLNNGTPGAAPVGTVILQNDAIVGIGTSERNVTSVQASMVLGENGLTLVANGNGQVVLNQDTLINNLCHILTGTAFGTTTPQQLLITSQVPRELRVKSTGILDLTQFTNYNQILSIGGQVKLVVEPGAQIVMGSGSLFFVDNAQFVLEPFINISFPTGTSAASTNPYRVQFSSVCTSTGVTCNPSRITFKENSRMFIPRDALLGIEANACVNSAGLGQLSTAQSWLISDDAQVSIGGDINIDEFGGGLQVGNVVTQTGTTIDFTLIIDGQGALFEIGSQGFFGIGLGIANKPEGAPDSWTIDDLSNVRNVTITHREGTISNRSLAAGSSNLASLIALGFVSGTYTFSMDRVNGEVLGGGNLITTGSATGAFSPVVDTTFGTIVTTGTSAQSVTYSAGFLASRFSMLDTSKITGNANPVVITGPAATLYNFWVMNPYGVQNAKTATLVPATTNSQLIGFVLNSTIFRRSVNTFRSGGALVGPTASLEIGTVGLTLDTSNPANPAATTSVLNP